MPDIEVVFTSFAAKYGAKPGDRKKVPTDVVPGLVADGIAKPVDKPERKERT